MRERLSQVSKEQSPRDYSREQRRQENLEMYFKYGDDYLRWRWDKDNNGNLDALQ